MYFDMFGEMQGINQKSGDELHIKFDTRGWGTTLSRMSGYVKNNKGKKVIEISGSWGEKIFVTNLVTKEKTCMW